MICLVVLCLIIQTLFLFPVKISPHIQAITINLTTTVCILDASLDFARERSLPVMSRYVTKSIDRQKSCDWWLVFISLTRQTEENIGSEAELSSSCCCCSVDVVVDWGCNTEEAFVAVQVCVFESITAHISWQLSPCCGSIDSLLAVSTHIHTCTQTDCYFQGVVTPLHGQCH